MAEYKIMIEGQEIPVPEEIGASDENVKKALAPFFPDAANAMITRTEKDGVVTVNVIKKAGTKGANSPLEILVSIPESKNPAVELYEQLQTIFPEGMSAEGLVAFNDEIERTIQDGEKQGAAIEAAKKRLQAALPAPAPAVVVGF